MPVTLSTVGTAMAGLFSGLYRMLGWLLLAAVVVMAAYWLGYTNGRVSGATKVATAAVQSAAGPVSVVDDQRVQDAQAQVQRADAGGRQHEAVRTVIETRFRYLERAAHAAPADPVDGCTLPAERLQLWTHANAGPDGADPAAGQPDHAAPAPAAASLGPDAGPGSQPPRDGPPVPPSGQPDVRPADLPERPDAGV